MDVRHMFETGVREERGRLATLARARIARGRHPGDPFKAWNKEWIGSGLCTFDGQTVKQVLFPPQPPGFWPELNFGACREDMEPPVNTPHHTLRLVIGTTPEEQTGPHTGWGVVAVRGGTIGHGPRFPSPITDYDFVGEMAVGQLTSEAGGRIVGDDVGAALEAWTAAATAITTHTLTTQGHVHCHCLMV